MVVYKYRFINYYNLVDGFLIKLLPKMLPEVVTIAVVTEAHRKRP